MIEVLIYAIATIGAVLVGSALCFGALRLAGVKPQLHPRHERAVTITPATSYTADLDEVLGWLDATEEAIRRDPAIPHPRAPHIPLVNGSGDGDAPWWDDVTIRPND